MQLLAREKRLRGSQREDVGRGSRFYASTFSLGLGLAGGGEDHHHCAWRETNSGSEVRAFELKTDRREGVEKKRDGRAKGRHDGSC
jgi:hypothetical protein